MKLLFTIIFSSLILFAHGEDPIHQQLRDARQEIIAAVETRDIEKMLAHVHPEATVTWQNGDTSHGIKELRAFYDRMGKKAFVAYKVPHNPDQLSVLHGGDTAIAAGNVVAEYELLGKSFEFDSRWTATFVLDNNKWMLSSYHISLNALDNPILNAAKSTLWIFTLAGLIVGILLSLIICKIRSGKKV